MLNFMTPATLKTEILVHMTGRADPFPISDQPLK